MKPDQQFRQHLKDCAQCKSGSLCDDGKKMVLNMADMDGDETMLASALAARALAALPEISVTGELPRDIQVFPPGRDVEFTLADYPGEVFHMDVDESVARRANDQLQNMLARARANQGSLPFADKNHEDGEATFNPTEFYWGGEDSRTGGVRLRGEWTGYGAQLVRAKAFRYFSGNFLFSRSAKKFLGLINENIGGLVNRPGFSTQQAFAKADSGKPQQTNSMTEKEIQDAIANGIAAGLKPVVTRLDTLEASAKGATAASASAADDSKITKLITDALKPVSDKLAEFDTREKNNIKAQAKAAVQRHVQRGAIAPEDTAAISFWEESMLANASAAEAQLNRIPAKKPARIIANPAGGTQTATAAMEPEERILAKAKGDKGVTVASLESYLSTPEGRADYEQYRNDLISGAERFPKQQTSVQK